MILEGEPWVSISIVIVFLALGWYLPSILENLVDPEDQKVAEKKSEDRKASTQDNGINGTGLREAAAVADSALKRDRSVGQRTNKR